MPNNNNKNYENPLDMLYQIVGELWPADKQGAKPETAPAEDAQPAVPAGNAGAEAPAAEKKPAAPAAERKPEKAEKPAKPAVPPFEEFWRRADERVEWTELLHRLAPEAGGMAASRWAYLRERAKAVLAGDLNAYAEVLRFCDPLSDLRPYAGEVTVSAPDADRAVVTFTAHPAEGVDAERLLAGLALRCARDVLALLPVVQVDVTGKLDSGETLTVTYPYSSLRKAAFGFIDPARYARELGGTFEL